MSQKSAAVVGAGPSGLCMLKQLHEDGFSVTGFERRGRVGGLWAYSEDPTHTSALPRTRAILSKLTCGFSDYPMPEKYPLFLSAVLFQEYMENYARHFDTLRYWVFNASVKKTFRNSDDTKWCLEVETPDGSKTVEFDKVVFCHGYQTRALVPQFEGQDKFQGVIMHSQQYRSPEPFAGKRVIVLGLSSTSADIIPDLLPHAAHPLYVSHRHGALLLRRFQKGFPTDTLFTWRRRRMAHFVQKHIPGLGRVLGDIAVGYFIRSTYPDLKPEWRLQPIQSLALKISSSLVFESIQPALEDGSAQSVHGIKRFLGPKKVELLDGVVLDDIDAVVLCTGYRGDFGLVDESVVQSSIPTAHGYDKDPAGGMPMYRLWMNMFPPRHADSLAMLCYSAFGKSNGFSFSDVTAMAVSNVFRGTHALPSVTAMEKSIDEHQAWMASLWKLDNTVDLSMVRQWEFQAFLHEAAGTGMDNLSWFGWKGWKFWWHDREMYNLMCNGTETAHMYRYFETGKRRTWAGARDAILAVEEEKKRLFPLSPEMQKEALAM